MHAIAKEKLYPVKCYVVFQWNNVALPGEPNIRAIACKLNAEAAQSVVDTNPGAYIEKMYANRIPGLTPMVKPKDPQYPPRD